MGSSHTVQAPSPTLYGVGGNQATGSGLSQAHGTVHHPPDVSGRLLHTPRWGLPTVLRGLSRDPFEPLSQDPLDALFFKTALLMALVSAKRACELTALSVSPSCLLLNEDSSFKLLRPNPA